VIDRRVIPTAAVERWANDCHLRCVQYNLFPIASELSVPTYNTAIALDAPPRSLEHTMECALIFRNTVPWQHLHVFYENESRNDLSMAYAGRGFLFGDQLIPMMYVTGIWFFSDQFF